MPRANRDYFRYFPHMPDAKAWGLGLTGAGQAHCLPDSPYPPPQHPTDHDFAWERGRVLDALQIVMITAGQGEFESHATGHCKIEAGTAFALLPGVWHRYRPDPKTGWEESWMEVDGPVVNRLVKNGVFSAVSAIAREALHSELEAALEAVHVRARHATASFDPELSARALAVLTSWVGIRQSHPEQLRSHQAMIKAERYLTEHQNEAVDIAELARTLGVGYSHFRRLFREHTGCAPWQYVLRLRLSRGRRLLAASDATLDDIAARLGFSSAFHFSAAFKRAYSLSPTQWRQKLWSESNRPAK